VLSIACFASPHRERTRRCLAALGAQTAVTDIELILLDGGDPDELPPSPAGLATTVERLPAQVTLGAARAQGVRAAASDSQAIAFLSDHCYPEPGWAEALIDAYRGPWAAVGFAFKCDGARTYGGRAAKFADHGPWLHPTAGGATDAISYGEASFRRDFLDSLGDELESALETDYSLHSRIREAGLPMAVEPRAVLTHENVATVLGNARLSYHWCRLLGARHLGERRRSLARRILYALAAPVFVPVLRTVRLIRSIRGSVAPRQLAAAMPAILVKNIFEGFGQAHGYLRGEGDSGAMLMQAELLWPRARCE
jgi:GT2 family glycosyltransferase